jgi:hypothetical protein
MRKVEFGEVCFSLCSDFLCSGRLAASEGKNRFGQSEQKNMLCVIKIRQI